MSANLDVNEWPASLRIPLTVPKITMMTPGPTNIYKNVCNILRNDTMAPFQKELFQMLDEIKQGIQYLFQTRNTLTLAVMASGHGAMETSLCNLVEDGDVVLIGVTGKYSERAASMAKRYGADVRTVTAPSGEILPIVRIKEALELHRPSVFYITHGDSSTGLLNPIEGLGDLCHKYNCLLIVDAVASIGGMPFHMDRWGVDVVFTASQKVLGAPSGLAPISFSEQAKQKILTRKSLIKVFYFDMKEMGDYWGCWSEHRKFHTTLSTTLLYGLREALAIICQEGLESLWKRYAICADKLVQGAKDLNFELMINDRNERMTTVVTFFIPKHTSWNYIQTAMINNNMDIGFGLEALAGKIIRIGLMGPNATEEHVQATINILKEAVMSAKLNSV